MLEKNLSEQILSIGNRSDRPDGGISQVLYNYRFYPKIRKQSQWQSQLQ